jgi:sarcosine oxidase subunit alpha
MNQPLKRLNTAHNVNTQRKVYFHFDGETYVGAEGDSLASALMANGIKRLGRSFKLHRPRGLMAAGREEPNALMQLEGHGFDEPNVRATLAPLYDGMRVQGQNAWPNVNWDFFGILSLFHRMFPASFYYKALMWPSWHFYEALVRRLAGLGVSPKSEDPQKYYKRNFYCEVMVVGGGPAGLAAARAAAVSGQRVLLVDEQEAFGGSLLGSDRVIEGSPAAAWVEQKVTELTNLENVTLLKRTTAIGYYDQNFLTAVERVNNHLGPHADLQEPRERLWRIRAKRVVLASGAIERPLVFANNDRPGIMLANAIGDFAYRYGVAAGKNIVFFTNNDSAYRTAIECVKAGMTVSAIVDTRASVTGGEWQRMAGQLGIELYLGYGVARVHGYRELRGVTLARHLGDGVLGEPGPKLHCDVLGMSGGWTPSIHLYSQAGGKLDFDMDKSAFVPKSCTQQVSCVGACSGDFALLSAIKSGAAKGALAASVPIDAVDVPSRCDDRPEQALQTFWYTKSSRTDKQWIDFQYDVKVADLELATRENFVSIEHVKRYTTNGMSVDQGKTSNVNGLAVMAELTGRSIPEVGTTKFRPPYHPVTLGAIGGRNINDWYAPRMFMPAHDWHVQHNGVMRDFGGWTRPDYYLLAGEDEQAAIYREVLAVRNSVGLFEGSPLGKIEIKGPDAATFLNRMYINNLATMKPGKARYGLITNENGVIIDDGVVVRFSEFHFMLHTTSGGASRISQWLEEWLQCEWLDLQVIVNNVSTQWANVTVSGPKARAVLERMKSDINFAAEAFPHMEYREGTINGVQARILRASYTGEVSYEINVPARYGLALWEAVYEAGAEFGITPYGVESLMALRTEKGFLHIGADTDGNTNPLDVGWGASIAKKAGDFIGRRSLSRPESVREDRLQFIGIKAIDPKQRLPIGGHIIRDAAASFPVESEGYVTSACMSPTLNASVGLGIVAAGRSRLGESVYVYANGKTVAVELVSAAHYDPKGERLNG